MVLQETLLPPGSDKDADHKPLSNGHKQLPEASARSDAWSAWVAKTNNYRWLMNALTGYFVILGSLAAAVLGFGEACVSKALLAGAGFLFLALTGRSVYVRLQDRQRQVAQVKEDAEWVKAEAAVQLMLPNQRAVYYGLCSLLCVSLFYTTGLSFIIAQFLFHCGLLPDPSSSVWRILFPLRSAPGPSTGEDILAMGKGIYNDLPPFAVISILLEAYIVCKFLPEEMRPRSTYTAGDSFLSLMVFALPLYMINTVMIDWGQPVYNFLFEHLRVTDAFASEGTVVGFWACLISADFCYYLFHRTSHIMSWFWTSHAVHHSSETFNLTNGPREGTATLNFTPSTLLDIMPLAFFFPFSVANPAAQVKLVWQFWFHAVLAPPWPTLELIFNTPSLHRVHHAKNEDRLGKNYGAIFSVWDRIFGTYEPELRQETDDTRDDLYYGIIPVLRTWDAVWLNVQPWYDMFSRQRDINGMAAPFLHWTPVNGKCPKLGSRLNPREYNPKGPSTRTWFRYTMFEMVVFLVFGLWVSFENLKSSLIEQVAGPKLATMIPNIMLLLFGVANASCIGLLMVGESEQAWRAEASRQVLLIALAGGFLCGKSSACLAALAFYAIVRVAALVGLKRQVGEQASEARTWGT